MIFYLKNKNKAKYGLSVIMMIILVLALSTNQGSAKSIYYSAKGNGSGTFDIYTNPAICSAQGFTAPCARYDENSLRIDIDRNSVKYQVQNNLGQWRWIQFNILNPSNIIPSIDKSSKSLVWINIYANTNLSYKMQSHSIKLNIWGNGVPPGNYFNFTYTLSSGVTYRLQGEEILFLDVITGEPLWLLPYPSMQIDSADVPLSFKRDGNKISIHAPDLFISNYNFSAGWILDPSVQSANTIYIVDRKNLTEVNADIANASALQNLGLGEWH